MSDEDRNVSGGFNSSTFGNLNSGNSGQQYSAGVNAFDSESSANLKLHLYEMNQISNGNYAGGSSSTPSGPSVLGELISGLFEGFVKVLGFFFKVLFYYMPKYHTKTFIVFLLALATLIIIHSPQVDKWNYDGQFALVSAYMKPLPSSAFGVPEDKPEKVNGFKSLIANKDLNNRALLAAYHLGGYDKAKEDLDKRQFEMVLRDRLLFKTPEPVMGGMTKAISKLFHQNEPMTSREEGEFLLMSCELTDNFTKSSNFPNLSKDVIYKINLEQALIPFNKDCNKFGKRWDNDPIGMTEYLLRQTQLDAEGKELLANIQSSPVFIFDRHKQDVSGMLTMFLGILFTWVSFRRDGGKEKKAESGTETLIENPADFSAKT